jgi:hypothetical protein
MRRPAEYHMFSNNGAMDFQRAGVAADVGQHLEEMQPVVYVYRNLSGLLKLLEKVDVC